MKKLTRSKSSCMLFGICGGLGEYFNIDPNIIRLIVLLLTIFASFGIIIVYILAYFIIPEEDDY